MDAEAYISALYRAVLGRNPDPSGLANWTRLLQETADPTAVLAGLLSSEEFQLKRDGGGQFKATERLILAIVSAIGRALTIVDVGAQNLAAETHIYRSLCSRLIPHHIIGFEPLPDRLEERRASSDGESLEMLPYAIGDGLSHVLHINNEDATSSLFPLNKALISRFEHLSGLRTVEQKVVDTKRLDDILPRVPVDFLKLDVQGAEALVLQGAERTLRQTAVIHCEVEFAQIYRDQPLYPTIQVMLNGQGFELIDLKLGHHYSYLVPSGRNTQDQLLWADAIFFNRASEPPMLVIQALVALLVYDKPSLAEYLLTQYDTATGSSLAGLMP